MSASSSLIPALLLLCAPAPAVDDYIGAAACGACHKTQFAGQSSSGHAQALHRALEHPLAGSFAPPPLRRPPNFRLRFVRTAQGIEVQADDSKYIVKLPAEWAFGAGAHAVTFVGKASDELYIEHAFSYYSDTRSFDITPQHEALPTQTLHQAMGQAIRIDGAAGTIRDCFQCHSTGPVSVSANHEIRIAEAGVRCEVCHGPGRAHAAAPSKNSMKNPRALSAGEMNRFCGRCHRFQEDARTIDWSDPWNARHQPPSLGQSQCFQKSGGGLSCLTCHDPHDKHDAAYYNGKCASCHQQTADHGADCAGCHMPLVVANQHLKFRNHWIGIYHDGATLRPVR